MDAQEDAIQRLEEALEELETAHSTAEKDAAELRQVSNINRYRAKKRNFEHTERLASTHIHTSFQH